MSADDRESVRATLSEVARRIEECKATQFLDVSASRAPMAAYDDALRIVHDILAATPTAAHVAAPESTLAAAIARLDAPDVRTIRDAARIAHLEAALAAAEARLRAVEALGRETCREWPDDEDRCDRPAEFILWGKLFPPEALGPRCYGHAMDHTSHSMASRSAPWAVFDLRPLALTTTQPAP